MDPARFYGYYNHVNTIPGDGNESEDDIDSDCDENCFTKSTLLPPRRHIIIPGSDSDFSEEDDVPLSSLQSASTSKSKGKATKTKVNWKNGKMPAYDANNFKFTGNTDLPDSIKKTEFPCRSLRVFVYS